MLTVYYIVATLICMVISYCIYSIIENFFPVKDVVSFAEKHIMVKSGTPSKWIPFKATEDEKKILKSLHESCGFCEYITSRQQGATTCLLIKLIYDMFHSKSSQTFFINGGTIRQSSELMMKLKSLLEKSYLPYKTIRSNSSHLVIKVGFNTMTVVNINSTKDYIGYTYKHSNFYFDNFTYNKQYGGFKNDIFIMKRLCDNDHGNFIAVSTEETKTRDE